MAVESEDKFPSYAELTQTHGWARGATAPIVSAADEPGMDPDSRYTEQAVLGVGGMGKIVLAHDARIGRDVAVKQMRPDRELSPEEISRFLREAQVQGQLEHPSIVPVYDIDRWPDGTTFFTMRRVLGRTLEDILEDLRRGVPEAVARYTHRELLQAFGTVCLAVDYAHSRGVIHRDLKPGNIMLGDFGEVYEPRADLEQESGIAIRELARALALEPTNQEHVAMFTEIMSAPPRTTPPVVRARIEAEQQSVLHAGARYTLLAALAWFLFLPPALALGVRRFDYVLLVALPVCLSMVLSLAAMRQRPIRRPIQCTAIAAIMLAAVAASRVLGPLFLMPMILAVWAIAMQTSPDPFVRRFSFAAGLVLLLAPLALELAGVVPSSYAFEDGKLIALPQMLELPKLGTFVLVTLANVVSVVVPSIFVARLRSDLTGAQERELLQAWQFRRLAAELMHASPG